MYICAYTHIVWIVFFRAQKVNMTACNQSRPKRYKYVRVIPNFIFYNEDPVPLLPVSMCNVRTHVCVCVCTCARVCTFISVCAYLRVCVYMRGWLQRKNTADLRHIRGHFATLTHSNVSIDNRHSNIHSDTPAWADREAYQAPCPCSQEYCHVARANTDDRWS